MNYPEAMLKMANGYRVRRQKWSTFALYAYIHEPPRNSFRAAVFIECDDGQRVRWHPRVPEDYDATDWIEVDEEILFHLITSANSLGRWGLVMPGVDVQEGDR